MYTPCLCVYTPRYVFYLDCDGQNAEHNRQEVDRMVLELEAHHGRQHRQRVAGLLVDSRAPVFNLLCERVPQRLCKQGTAGKAPER